MPQQLPWEREVSTFVVGAMQCLPASDGLLTRLHQEQKKDPECQTLFKIVEQGWPPKERLPADMRPYWSPQGSLIACNRLPLMTNRIIIRRKPRRDMLQCIHEGHQGIGRYRAKTRVHLVARNEQCTCKTGKKLCSVCEVPNTVFRTNDTIKHTRTSMAGSCSGLFWFIFQGTLSSVSWTEVQVQQE